MLHNGCIPIGLTGVGVAGLSIVPVALSGWKQGSFHWKTSGLNCVRLLFFLGLLAAGCVLFWYGLAAQSPTPEMTYPYMVQGILLTIGGGLCFLTPLVASTGYAPRLLEKHLDPLYDQVPVGLPGPDPTGTHRRLTFPVRVKPAMERLLREIMSCTRPL